MRNRAGQQIRGAGYVGSTHLGIGVGTASIKRTGARQPGSQESRIDFQFYNLGRNLLPALNFTLIGHYDLAREIGRASCRERVCQYVSISVVAGALKKKKAETAVQ